VTSQIFYDQTGRRWRRFKATAHLAAIALLVVFGVLAATVASDPALHQHSLSSLKVFSKDRHVIPAALRLQEPHFQIIEPDTRRLLSALPQTAALPTRGPTGVLGPVRAGEGERIGFYVDRDASSLASLKRNLSHLDKLIPEWLHATKANGAIAIDNLGTEKVLAYVRQRRPQMPIVPLVNNYNAKTERWETIALSRMLADPQARAHAIEHLLKFVRQIEGTGICVDFEGIPLSDPDLGTFLGELAAQFHPHGLEVAQQVPLDDPSADYRALGRVSDYLILSAYDERSMDDQAGPVASQAWYVDALQRRFGELAPAKYVIAIGNYGYDWNGDTVSAAELSVQEVINIARESAGGVTFDDRALNPTLRYYGDDRQMHRVWFLDAVTAFNQLAEGQRYGPRGFALWRLGTEDPSIWQVFDRRSSLDQRGARALEVLPPGDTFDDVGRGEILKVAAGPNAGTRAITYSGQSGLILSEHITAYSSAYVIARWGGEHAQKIALTFDDGPDALFTPAVLDILSQYQVPATFFVIGSKAMFNAELIRRIVGEGHEVGNHTLTHPNIATISEQQLGVELNATERFLESTLGRRFLLFRPPLWR
jgi:spore germination protein YaaH